MAMENSQVVIGKRAGENSCLSRRKMVQRLLVGASAGAAWPLVATSHPIYEVLRNNEAILDEAEQLEAAGWKPSFLSSQQD